jgi:1-acyl-sn-glycerol-3-phosphate acyltransferase
MSLWYTLVKNYVRLGLSLYFRKIQVIGTTNIPSTGPVMFTINHQNAFLDALLVATTNKRLSHFLVRADVFKFGMVRKIFSTLNMMPVYRIRDGRSSLINNHQIFQRCYAVLQQQQAIMLFPEANHHQKRLLLPLSKGFTRIALGAEQPVLIVPVGINYTHHRLMGGSVSVYYGKPVSTEGFVLGNAKDHRKLTDQVKKAMQELITSIPDDEHYQQYEDYLNQDRYQYLDPDHCNQWIQKTTPQSIPRVSAETSTGFIRNLAKAISSSLNFLPILVNKMVLDKLNDRVFSSSIKFLSGIMILPVYYLVLALLLFYFAGPDMALMIVGLGICSLFARKQTLRY